MSTASATLDVASQANALVRDLNRIRPAIYWADLLCSAALGWGAFAAAFLTPAAYAIPLAGVAALALYRALCFIHEISHQSARSLPGFERFWNLAIGFPLLLPSIMYTGVHPDHHRLSTYGTENDPEYLPFARSARMTVAFCAQSLLLPGALLIRFLLLAPLGFLIPQCEKWLAVHFSSLCINVNYRRPATQETLRSISLQSAGILALWAVPCTLAVVRRLPLRFIILWYAVTACISLINTLRTLGAHAYASEGRPLSREEQLQDSIDTPAMWLGILWAPVGLRFHGLHHYFPGIPYHNLGEAYRQLTTKLPAGAAIHRIRSNSLSRSLCNLYVKGARSHRTGTGSNGKR